MKNVVVVVAPSPSYSNLSLAFLFGGLALLLLRLVLRERKGKKIITNAFDSLPGPRQYFLGSWLNLLEVADNKKILPVVAGWCAKFGPVTRVDLGPWSRVLLSSPHHIHKLLGSMEGAHLVKPKFFTKVLRPAVWVEGLVNSYGEKWRSRRKLLNPYFKLQSLRSWTPAFNEGGRRLVASLAQSHTAVAPAPILSPVVDTTLATICKTMLGIDFDAEGQQHSRTKYNTAEFLTGTKRFLEIASTRMIQPWLAFEPLFNLTSASKELRQFYHSSSKFMVHLAEDVMQVQEGRGGKSSNSNNNKSLLRELIQAGLENEGIYEETLTMIIAGYETTAATLETLLFFLALHPGIQEKCHREVDQVFQKCDDDDAAPFAGDFPNITLNALKDLEYLEQCLLESLRIVPTFPFLIRELEAPLQLDDELELPSGTNVVIPLAAIHLNPEIYPEPERFDPDRMAAERRKERSPYSFLPFSAGARKCIGAKFATSQILILAAHILKHFTVRTTSAKSEEVVWLFNVSMRPETPIKFIFEKRECYYS